MFFVVLSYVCVILRLPPRSTRTATTFPCTTLCRSPPPGGAAPRSRSSAGNGGPARPPRRACRRSASRGSPDPRPPHSRPRLPGARRRDRRSEEHTSELQSLMRISYAVFCLKKKQYTQLCQFILIPISNTPQTH